MQMRSAYNASMQQQQRTSNKQSFFYAKHVLFHAIEHRDWHRRNVRSKRIHSFRHLYTFIKKSEVNLNKKKMEGRGRKNDAGTGTNGSSRKMHTKYIEL